MSRKNLLSSLTEKRKFTAVNSQEDNGEAAKGGQFTAVNSTGDSTSHERSRHRGAFGAITKSIDELAEKALVAKDIQARLREGATVVDLDTNQIDSSFIIDRLGSDEEAFSELVEAIRERGQDSPILVRPHPTDKGRYMVVFGHRRVRAAAVLNRPVRAVVKELSDQDHVVAQGQENSARANLSFIEKALFASKLDERGYERDLIMKALSVNKTVVSKMLSVSGEIPADLIKAIGAAKNTGRDSWYAFAKMIRDAGNLQRANELIETVEFQTLESDARLEWLKKHLEEGNENNSVQQETEQWQSKDQSLSVTIKRSGKGATISLSKANGDAFAVWLKENLAELYSSFINDHNTGD